MMSPSLSVRHLSLVIPLDSTRSGSWKGSRSGTVELSITVSADPTTELSPLVIVLYGRWRRCLKRWVFHCSPFAYGEDPSCKIPISAHTPPPEHGKTCWQTPGPDVEMGKTVFNETKVHHSVASPNLSSVTAKHPKPVKLSSLQTSILT
jgi:hypothetical protein